MREESGSWKDGWRGELVVWCQLVSGRQEGTRGAVSSRTMDDGFEPPVVPVLKQRREKRKKGLGGAAI